MSSNNSPNQIFERLRSFVRRPLLGSFVFGLFVEGVPVGTFLYLLGLDRVGISLPWLMPLSVLVVFLGAILGAGDGPGGLLRRSFLTSLGGLFPVLVVAWAMFLWDFRLFAPSIDVRNLPWAGTVIGQPVLLVTILGWLLALAFRFLRNRYSFTTPKAGANPRTP